MASSSLPITPTQARDAVGALSLALGAAAVLAPVRTASAFGVRAPGIALPLLVRMVGVRNAALGLRTLQADGGEQARSVQAGLALGVVDAAALLVAARAGGISRAAAVGGFVVLAALAGLGVVAVSDRAPLAG